MNNHIKNMLFYGGFGGFGLYTFYEVSKSEFNKSEKSNFYFHRMLNEYQNLEDCNFNHFSPYKNPIINLSSPEVSRLISLDVSFIKDKETIIKSLNPNNITHHPECTIFYKNFKSSYDTYKFHKYDCKHNYGI